MTSADNSKIERCYDSFFSLTRAEFSVTDLSLKGEPFSLGFEEAAHVKRPREPVMGFEPMASFLPRMCATPAPHGPNNYRDLVSVWWAVEDSNLRSSRN